MIIRPLALSGSYEVLIEPKADERGMFARIFCSREFTNSGLNVDWPQMNVALSVQAGTLRGMHFQRPPYAECKLVRALNGRAHDVIVDLRSGSESFGQHVSLELDSETRNAIYVPEGFAHGYQALTANCELQYFCSSPYAPEAEGGVQALDPELGIQWPLTVTVRSQRDQELPPCSEVSSL